MSTNSIANKLVVVGLVVVSLAAGPAAPVAPPAPVGGDESGRAREVFGGLVQQGTNALMAGEYGAALGALLDAKQVFERKLRGKRAQVGGPEHVAMLHGLALAYQLSNKPDKASPLFENGTPLDRACAAKGAGRQLLLTRATLDLTQGYLAMRTAVGLTAYLKEHPNELDSEILDVLFSALTKAEERVTSRAMLDAMIKNYDEFNARLEATRPGKRRWGVAWVDEAEFKVNMKKREAALREVDKALGQVSDADADIVQAKQLVKWARGGQGSLSGANAKLTAAENRRSAAMRAVDDARSKLPPIPVLGKPELARLIEPHEAKVVVAAKPTKPTKAAGGTPTQVASAQPETKSIEFTLGGGSSGTKGATGGAAGDVGTGSEPPAPPARGRTSPRGFNRTATGFAVGPDLLLTAASAVKDAKRVVVEFPNAAPVEATVERSGAEGLALLRLAGQKMAYVNLAEQFAGGGVQCPAYPEVSVFGVAVEVIKGRALAAQDEGWKVALGKHPRLPGAPLLNDAGDLVGVEMAEREDLTEKLPALSMKAVRGFMGGELPGQLCGNPKAAAVVQVTGTFER
jgi:hypothetical protein